MLPIRAKLLSCVSDMTQQGKQALFENYFATGFTSDTFEITVYLNKDTFKVFTLDVAYSGNSHQAKESLAYVLSADNADFGKELLFQGKLVITQNMTVLSAITCALHVSGDYIKFAFNPISEESEKNHNA